MNVLLVVAGIFLAVWMMANLIFVKVTRSNNLLPAAIWALGAALIVWGIIG